MGGENKTEEGRKEGNFLIFEEQHPRPHLNEMPEFKGPRPGYEVGRDH